MGSNNKYTVTISDRRKIPHIGFGPIRNPIKIDEDQYNLLKTLGFHMNVIDVPKKKEVEGSFEGNKKEESINKEIIEDNTKDVLDEDISEDVDETEEVEEFNEEEIEEDFLDTNDEDISEDVDETEEVEEFNEEEIEEDSLDNLKLNINSLTKAELKSKLDELKVSYPSNANLKKLRSLLREEIK